MKVFKDASGGEWTPRIDGDVVFEYEDRTGISLFKVLGTGDVFNVLPGFREFAILLWLSVQEKATARGVKEKDFRRMLHGEVFEGAAAALMEALFDFFPKLRPVGATLQRAMEELVAGNLSPDETSSLPQPGREQEDTPASTP